MLRQLISFHKVIDPRYVSAFLHSNQYDWLFISRLSVVKSEVNKYLSCSRLVLEFVQYMPLQRASLRAGILERNNFDSIGIKVMAPFGSVTRWRLHHAPPRHFNGALSLDSR